MVQINAADMKNLASSNLIDTGMANSFGAQAADNGMMFTCTLKCLTNIFAKLPPQLRQSLSGIQPVILQIIVLFLKTVRRPETKFLRTQGLRQGPETVSSVATGKSCPLVQKLRSFPIQGRKIIEYFPCIGTICTNGNMYGARRLRLPATGGSVRLIATDGIDCVASSPAHMAAAS